MSMCPSQMSLLEILIGYKLSKLTVCLRFHAYDQNTCLQKQALDLSYYLHFASSMPLDLPKKASSEEFHAHNKNTIY